MRFVDKYDLRRVKAKLKAGDSLNEKSHGGHNKKLTSEALNEVNLKYKINPFMSTRKLAKSMEISQKTARIARDLLGLKSKKRPRRQLLTEKTRESRVVKAKKLRNLLKKTKKSTILIFSDKKMFWLAGKGGLIRIQGCIHSPHI